MLEIIVAIIGAVIGGLFTLAAVFIQRGKKVVAYAVSSMPLLRFKPLDNTLTISVDKSLLTGNQTEKGTFEQINNATGFQIRLLNVGNDDVEKPNIEIELDKEAKIISYEIQPLSRPGYEINVQKEPSQPNILRVLVPFINKKESVLLRLISTGNTNRECKVAVLGFGIKYHKAKTSLYPLILTSISASLSLLLALLISIPILPSSFFISLGGSYSTPSQAKTATPPLWWIILLISFYILALIGIFWYGKIRSDSRKAMKWNADDK